jgi:hypothetical protein
LVGTQATDVAGERVQRLGQKVLNAERPQDSEQVPDTDPAIGCLDASDYSSRDVGALCQLSLRKTAQLAPGSDALCQAPLSAANRDRRGSAWCFMLHM